MDRIFFPQKRGGLGVRNPLERAIYVFSTSQEAASCLVKSISNLDQHEHKSKLNEAWRNHEDQQDDSDRKKLRKVHAVLQADQSVQWRSIKNCCSLWLTSLPPSKDNFELSKTEFTDARSR